MPARAGMDGAKASRVSRQAAPKALRGSHILP
jgi:hypothetical protein